MSDLVPKQKSFLPVYLVEVPSFTDHDVLYIVDTIKKTCTCPAWQKGIRRPCKHMKSITGLVPENPTHPSNGQAMSALIKATRMRNFEDTFHWFWHFWRQPDQRFRLIRRVFIMAGEDGLNLAVQSRIQQWKLDYKNANETNTARMLLLLLKTENWWSREDGHAMFNLWRGVDYTGAYKPYVDLTPQQGVEAFSQAVEDRNLWIGGAIAEGVSINPNGYSGENAFEFWSGLRPLVKERGSKYAKLSMALLLNDLATVKKDGNYWGQMVFRMFRPLGDPHVLPDVTDEEVEYWLDFAAESWKDPKPIPSHYLDGIHTSGSDRRFAGTPKSMLGMCKAYLRYGRLSPDDKWPPEFWLYP